MTDLSRILAALEAAEADHADLLTAIRCGTIIGADPEAEKALAGYALRLAHTLASMRAALTKQRAVTRGEHA